MHSGRFKRPYIGIQSDYLQMFYDFIGTGKELKSLAKSQCSIHTTRIYCNDLVRFILQILFTVLQFVNLFLPRKEAQSFIGID